MDTTLNFNKLCLTYKKKSLADDLLSREVSDDMSNNLDKEAKLGKFW